MRAVLGIDAAWTLTQPSGVATAVERHDGWHLTAVESSYRRFCVLAGREQRCEDRPTGSLLNVPDLLTSAEALCGRPMDLVSIDMPLARSPIVSRRASDKEVSRAYGARQCTTHSPSTQRPGRISDDLRASFEREGYLLCTDAVATRGIIEVYPHPALVELFSASKRLPYKVSKVRKYWPLAAPHERRALLYRQWREIVNLLEQRIIGVAAALPPIEQKISGWQMKSYEDRLDAVICVWVAICCLNGQATPYGDTNSAIWVPSPAARLS